MYDVVIIGAGPAGLCAALYAGRAGMKTLVVEQLGVGGQAALTYEVDNYPGVLDLPTGAELAERMKRHAEKFGAQFVSETVKSVDDIAADTKIVVTRKNRYPTKTVIFATGAQPRKLGVEGEDRLCGTGVSYCAYCDGQMCRGKDAVVVGGGNTAFEDALYLARFCENVALIHRSKVCRAEKNLVDKAAAEKRIIMLSDTVTEEILGDNAVNAIRVRNTRTNTVLTLETSAVFIAVGSEPRSALAAAVERDENGFIKTDSNMRTSVRGVFAAGDVRCGALKQIITAAADGATAATSAAQYVNAVG